MNRRVQNRRNAVRTNRKAEGIFWFRGESNNSYNQPDRLNPNQSPLHTTAIVPTATP